MDFKGRIRKILGVEVVENGVEPWDVTSIGNLVIPEKLSDSNCFKLCNSVAELDFPVDFYADRISKLRRFICDKNGIEIPNSEYLRLISDGINPFYSISDLIYQYVYSLLAFGSTVKYIQTPSIYKTLSPNNISRWDILNPDLLSIEEHSNLSLLDISNKQELIKKATYSDVSFRDRQLTIQNIFIDNYGLRKQENSSLFSKSPLFSRNKSIDTLLAVYSARYNVYANNGAAGYLAKKSLQANSGGLESIFDNVNHREAILDDINSRNGITGRKNLWGISGIPIEFIKTLATISELMPLEETLECSIKIASAFQIPAGLVPRKDQSTYDNQAEQESGVWENALIGMDQTVNENLARDFGLKSKGLGIKSDYSTVSALNQNAVKKEDLKTKQIANNTQLYNSGAITFNKYMISIGEEPIEGGDKYIYDMTKTPYAVKLGVGGTQAMQAMQAILTDQNMTLDMKKNTLVVIFGLTEQEASLIIK